MRLSSSAPTFSARPQAFTPARSTAHASPTAAPQPSPHFGHQASTGVKHLGQRLKSIWNGFSLWVTGALLQVSNMAVMAWQGLSKQVRRLLPS